jgi:hypothetical protein
MRFSNTAEFECLSKIMQLRRQGLTKVSFKECTMKENMLGLMITKQTLDNPHKVSLVKDISL